MATYLRGQLNSGSPNADAIVKEVDDEITQLEPSVTPLTLLMNELKNSRDVENPTFYCLKSQLFERFTQANTGATILAATTSWTVTDATILNAGDIVVIPSTGEHCLILTTPTGTTCTVTRAFGSTAAANIADQAYIQVIGSASSEGGGAPAANSRQLDSASNYTQIFKRAIDLSNTAQATRYYSGSEAARLMAAAGKEFAKDMELSALFGQKFASGTQRTSAGLLYQLTTNAYNAAGTMTEDNFEKNLLEPVFRYGSSTKLFFASPRVCTALDFWGRSKLHLPVDKNLTAKLGINVVTYTSTHGELKVIRHKLLEKAWSGYGFIVDIDEFRRVTLKGRGPKMLMNQQAPDIDGIKHQYLAEVGWEVRNEPTMGYVYGCTGGA